ncbi:hypothetical protein [Georgenia sp. SUBG003]|uniref:hypothetical protein n=1 Tax=Georgenia sp. SUBG003 TaxID=1497974 RepID=UPI003AB757B3
MTEERHVDVRAVRADDDPRAGDLARLNLLAMAQRGRERAQRQSIWVHEAARAAAVERIAEVLPGERGVRLGNEVGDAVLEAVLRAVREGPPEETEPPEVV